MSPRGMGEAGERPAPPPAVPPQKVVSALRARPGQRFLEAGCGDGDLFFAVVEAMGGEGTFLAAEWDEERLRRFLGRLEERGDQPGLRAVEIVRARPDRLPLPDASADVALLAHRFHALARRDVLLRELRRVLAPGGTLAVLDWSPPAEGGAEGPGGAGPAASLRVGAAQAAAELADAGFGWVVSHGGFEGHWCLTARAPRSGGAA